MKLAQAMRLFAALMWLCSVATAQPGPLAVVDEPLPPMEAGVDFHVLLHATGGAPPYSWSIASGDLPAGLTLGADGLLSGQPAKSGAFTVVIRVQDSGHPAHTINKDFHVEVRSSLLLEWFDPPKVHDNRIDGALQISNDSKDIFDLTVIVVAVAENGRATAIGYEHFPLNPGTSKFKIPFGNTLPHGGYTIHADAIAEIPTRKTILRQRLQTPQPLQVTQGP
jgi:Putative Ig domain